MKNISMKKSGCWQRICARQQHYHCGWFAPYFYSLR